MSLTAKKPKPKTVDEWVEQGREEPTADPLDIRAAPPASVLASPVQERARSGRSNKPQETINFKIDSDLKMKLQLYCVKHHCKVSEVLRDQILKFLG